MELLSIINNYIWIPSILKINRKYFKLNLNNNEYQIIKMFKWPNEPSAELCGRFPEASIHQTCKQCK